MEKDKIDKGKVYVEHCPTEQIWADVITKSQQGMQFCVMSIPLMNFPADYKEDEEMVIVMINPCDTTGVLKKSISSKSTGQFSKKGKKKKSVKNG